MTDVIDQAKGVASTFTSWDSCMSKTYCKWPVIAAIIIGALICLLVIWCIVSCCCLGITCASACGKCITCCGCCGMCSRSRKRDVEYRPMPPTPTPYQGYQPQPSPMMYNHGGPQFATFDAGNKRGESRIHEDSLPAMPSWDNAQTRRVEDHTPQPQSQNQQHQQQRGSDMEMEHMLPQSPVQEHPQQHLYNQQPYASDLGAQRLGPQDTGANADYYDPPTHPLSPAPTYHTTAPPMAGALAPTNRDRFSPQQHDRFSPQPQDHYNSSPYAYSNSYGNGNNHPASPAPYPSSRESTQFAAQRSLSPPSAPSYTPYQSPPLEQPQVYSQTSGVRPPSLLQVGRKPVSNSFKEV